MPRPFTLPRLPLSPRRPSLRADEIPRNELLVSISSPSSRLPSQSSLCLFLSSPPRHFRRRVAIASSTRRSLSLSSGSRVRSPGNSDELFARDRPFKSRFVPGIRLEIARNFVEAASSGLSRLQCLVKSLDNAAELKRELTRPTRFYRPTL